MSDGQSFGSGYYAGADGDALSLCGDPFYRRLAEVLDTRYPQLYQIVDSQTRQLNALVREHLRTETALRLTKGDDRTSVPVRVIDGFPLPFADLLSQVPDPLIWELSLQRPLLLDTWSGLGVLLERYDRLEAWLRETDGSGIESVHSDLARSQEFLDRLMLSLAALELERRIQSIDQDILGAYFFRTSHIQIYWMVIGVVASMLDLPPEPLTAVVLVHELAHAYTHVGYDIDGQQWRTGALAAADRSIVEGLAQFYTRCVCRKLEGRVTGISEAFSKLLEMQPPPYTGFQDWVADAREPNEVVRQTLIYSRANEVTDYQEFRRQLELGKHQTGRRHPAGPDQVQTIFPDLASAGR